MLSLLPFRAGEAHIVYTIAPRRDSLPDYHGSQECLLACHVQVEHNLVMLVCAALIAVGKGVTVVRQYIMKIRDANQ